tara:strand:+ start:2285 stop:2863 length:579 start_codon:yes stop_codon:yes gene_type:complete
MKKKIDYRHSLCRDKFISQIKILVIAFVFTSLVYALPSDMDQPIEIEANFAELDDDKGVTIYLGDVVVTQGSIRMTGDSLKVLLEEDRQIKEAFLEGTPATFRQTPKIGEEDVEGEAKIIEYYKDKQMVYLIEAAKVTQGKRLTQGHRMNYDIERSIVTVRSSRAGSVRKDEIDKKKAQRVKIILPPKEDED